MISLDLQEQSCFQPLGVVEGENSKINMEKHYKLWSND